MNEQALAAARAQPSAYLAAKLAKLRATNGEAAAIEVIATVLQERAPKPAKARKPRKRMSSSSRNADRIDGYDRDDLGPSFD